MACDRFNNDRPTTMKRRHHGLLIAAVLGVVLAGGLSPAIAQDGPNPKGGDAPRQPQSPRGEHRQRDGEGGGGGGGGPRRPSAEEWKAIEEFASQHSPNRLAFLKSTADQNTREYRFAQGFIVARYRGLEAMRESEPDLYAKRVDALELEDRIFGQVQKGAAAADAPKEQKDALREDMVKWVALNLEEREERIARMAAMLDDQRQKLESDKADQEQLVDRKMSDVERDGIKGLMPDGAKKFFDGQRGGDHPRPPEGGGERPPGGGPPPPPQGEPRPPMP